MTSNQHINHILIPVNYDVWRFMGDRNKNNRQLFMQVITGQKRPKAKCGVTALLDELLNKAGIVESEICKFEIPNKLKEFYDNVR